MVAFFEKHKTLIVWVLRLIVGATFVFSGFAKAVDPWGGMLKIEDYLAAWGIDWLSREVVFIMAALLALVEFMAGAMLMLGCLRRAAPYALMALMCFLLPLSLYIMIFSPVDDCGCFGDALVISNTATFIKNIVIVLLLLVLLRWNADVFGLYDPLVQWMAFTPCLIYCVILLLVGYFMQPPVDFRPYPVGKPLLADVSSTGLKMLYERDGVTQAFDIDALPDSTWTYIGRQEPKTQDIGSGQHLAIYDGDEEVTESVIETEGPEMLLVVSNPALHRRARASMANHVNTYIEDRGGRMIALVPLEGDDLEAWIAETNPAFETYTAEGTTLKELARGDAAMVYLLDGVIQWKRNIYSLPGDFPDFESPDNAFDDVYVVDSGVFIRRLTVGLVVVLVVFGIIGLPAFADKWHRRRNRSAK